MSPGGATRPGGPLPPREPVNPFQPGPPGRGPGSGPGRRPGGPGYAAPGGPPRPSSSGTGGAPGFSAPTESSKQFEGGYAYVIRAADNPVRPASPTRQANPAQSANAARPAGSGPTVDHADVDADLYVDRDTSEPSGPPAAAATEPGADERDTSYWYDLSGEDSAPVSAETRGPFEPLVSSSRLPSDPAYPAPPPSSSAQDPGGPGMMAQGAEGEPMAPDKHFDQLLAQQRELISEYFEQSDAGDGLAAREETRGENLGETRGGTQAEAPAGADLARLDGPGAPGRQPDVPPGARVTADQPRVW